MHMPASIDINNRHLALFISAISLFMGSSAQASEAGSRPVSPAFKLDVSGIYHADSEFETKTNAQGPQADLKRNSMALKLSTKGELDKTWSLGGNIGYERKAYDWSALLNTNTQAGVFDANAMPWQSVELYTLGLSLSYRANDNWILLLSPQIKYAYADTSSFSDGQSYGVVMSAMYRFSSNNMLGFGVAYLNDVNEVNTVPYLAVRWKISDKWLLSNPFKPGFSGPAGLELSYKVSDELELALGASHRSERFSVGSNEQSVDVQEWVSFVRASWQLSTSLELSAYGGYFFGGEIEIEPEGIRYDLTGQAATGLNLSISF
jgi:hypothetical protein